MSNRSEPITAYLTPEQSEALRARAEEEGRTVSAMVARILAAALVDEAVAA